MRFDYIKEHNAFFVITDRIYLSASAQLLWYRLFDVCNRSFGDGEVIMTNTKLASLIGTENIKKAAIARDELVNAGLIEYTAGKKGAPGIYRLLSVYGLLCGKNERKENAPENGVENDVEKEYKKSVENNVENDIKNDTENDTEYDMENDVCYDYIYNKTNTKNKTKTKTNTKTDTKTITEKSKKECAVSDGESDGKKDVLFDRFWNIYPKKRNYQKARIAFDNAGINDAAFAEIEQAIKKASRSRSWTTENGRFIPSPDRYIAERKFKEEPFDRCYDDDTGSCSFGDPDKFLEAAVRAGMAM